MREIAAAPRAISGGQKLFQGNRRGWRPTARPESLQARGLPDATLRSRLQFGKQGQRRMAIGKMIQNAIDTAHDDCKLIIEISGRRDGD